MAGAFAGQTRHEIDPATIVVRLSGRTWAWVDRFNGHCSVKLALRKRLHLVRGVAACTDVEEGPPAKGGSHLMSPSRRGTTCGSSWQWQECF
jgi:hypothetical protein